VRVLLLSDIHANLEAMEACLAEASSYDLVLNLGDIVGYGASPNEVIDRSRQLGKYFVRGNHDKACAGLMDVRGFNPIAAAAVVWTHHQLSPDNLKWLKALPVGPLGVDGLDGVQMVHGSPRDEDEYILVSEDAAVSAAHSQVPLTFFGHTHIQGGFRLEGNHETTMRPNYRSLQSKASWELKLEKGVNYMINPGSVGQPRDGDWRAGFAIFDSGNRVVTYYRVPYDIEKAQKRILEAKLPERLAARLTQGR